MGGQAARCPRSLASLGVSANSSSQNLALRKAIHGRGYPFKAGLRYSVSVWATEPHLVAQSPPKPHENHPKPAIDESYRIPGEVAPNPHGKWDSDTLTLIAQLGRKPV